MRSALSILVGGALASSIPASPALAAHHEEAAEAAAPESCTLTARDVATRFMEKFYLEGKVREAFMTWVDPDYIQHNPFAATGREAAMNFLEAAWAANPEREAVIHRVVAEDDLVVFHVESRNNPEERGSAVVDILRVKDCKVMEHWDVIQPIPESSVNGHNMFDSVEIATTGKAGQPCTMSTREVLNGFVPLLYGQGKVREAYEAYVHPDYQQHNPHAHNGRDAAITFLSSIYEANPNHRMTVYRMVVSDGWAAIHLHGQASDDDPGAAAVDFLRVDNCKIVEHFDVTQSVPEQSANDNTMF